MAMAAHLKRPDDAVGKTILGVVEDEFDGDNEMLLIVFKDKTALMVEAKRTWGEGAELEYDSGTVDPLRLDESTLRLLKASGYCDDGDVDELIAARERQRQAYKEKVNAESEAKERATYERLHKKYGASG